MFTLQHVGDPDEQILQYTVVKIEVPYIGTSRIDHECKIVQLLLNQSLHIK